MWPIHAPESQLYAYIYFLPNVPAPLPPYQGQEVIGHLRDGWVDTIVSPGDSINVLDVVPEPWTPGGPLHVVVDMQRGLVVLHPDVLLSGEIRPFPSYHLPPHPFYLSFHSPFLPSPRLRDWCHVCDALHCSLPSSHYPPSSPLPGTSVMSAMRCPRQAWLQEQLAGDTNDKALLGQLLHELLQWGLARAMELRQAGLGGLERQAMLDEVGTGRA